MAYRNIAIKFCLKKVLVRQALLKVATLRGKWNAAITFVLHLMQRRNGCGIGCVPLSTLIYSGSGMRYLWAACACGLCWSNAAIFTTNLSESTYLSCSGLSSSNETLPLCTGPIQKGESDCISCPTLRLLINMNAVKYFRPIGEANNLMVTYHELLV